MRAREWVVLTFYRGRGRGRNGHFNGLNAIDGGEWL
jgi:hypothetical protein